ncbi:MAG: hypothetical protein M3O34_08830 [Chloroflexota bacterium]|nr:hypothetical protein [Chloroflexota bacterium]
MASLSLPTLDRTAAPPDEVARRLVRVLLSLIRAIVADLHAAPHAAGMTLAQFRILGRLSERARDLPGDRRGALPRLPPAGRTVQHVLETRSIRTLTRLLGEVGQTIRGVLGEAQGAPERALGCDERRGSPPTGEGA